MRSRFSFPAVSGLFLLAATFASAQDIFVTPVPNAPFTGVIHVERSVVQRDGSVRDLRTIRDIGRDSRGRIFNESRTLLPASDTSTPQVMSVLLYDPQTRTSTHIFPAQRVFSTGTVNRPPETQPPALLDGSTTGNSIPRNDFTKQEDLGNRQMEGLAVHGVRETQTIPAENSPAGKEIVVTDEFWYSADLRINMLIKHSDPRTGSVTMTVTQVKRSEPDPALLEIPEGYKPFGARAETGAKQERNQ
ncbi:MAG TPA: hypothetical protein VKE93_21910 [Candidatus Angelobacter sp.]|nr:hypothetical protein [Candidatus Angelobacter sp.]